MALAKELANQSFKTTSGMIFNVEVQKIESKINNGGLSPLAKLLMDSISLPIALRECYPNSEIDRNLYVLSLLFADIEGTIAGMGVNVLGFSAMAKSVNFIASKMLWGPLNKLLHHSRLSKNGIENVRKSLVLTAFGASGYLTYQQVKNAREEQLKFAKEQEDYSLDTRIAGLEKKLIIAIENIERAKNSPYVEYWKNEKHIRLQKFYLELENILKNNQISSDKKLFWKAKYKSYLAKNDRE